MKNILTVGTYKYILAKDQRGDLFVVSKDLKWHKNIFDSEDDLIEVLGGGFINYNEKEKYIHIFGISKKYGHADRSAVRHILSQDGRFKDFNFWSPKKS